MTTFIKAAITEVKAREYLFVHQKQSGWLAKVLSFQLSFTENKGTNVEIVANPNSVWI